MSDTLATSVAGTEPNETRLHNSILEQSVSDLQAIETLVEDSETHLKSHHQAVRQALVAVFKLGLILHEHKLVRTFHKKQGLDFPKKAERNLFHGLITKAFEKSPRDDAKSKYRQILLFAHIKNYSTDVLTERLKEFGIEETYKAARNYLRNDFASLYEETNTERFDRAKTEIKSTKIGAVIKLAKNEDVPENFDGFTNAILRVTGRQLEIVAPHPHQTEEDVKAGVAALIDPEGSRIRTKLKQKNLYPLFTLADIFSRFVPSKSDVEIMEKAVRRQSMGPFEVADGDIDQADTIKRLIKRTKEPLKKFQRLSALVFAREDSQWTAETHSTLPSFPVVSFKFGATSQRISERPPLCVFDNQADDFQHWFLEPADWHLVRNKSGFTAKVPEGKSLEIGPWQKSSQNWRKLKILAEAKSHFKITKLDLREILGWKENRPIQFGRKPSFPKFMNLCVDEDQVYLQMGTDHTQRKRLGVLDGPSQKPNPIGDLTLAVEHINRVAKLSVDYGLGLHGVICEENGAPVALRLTSIDFWCPMTITLPLTISNYGAPTEICEFV